MTSIDWKELLGENYHYVMNFGHFAKTGKEYDKDQTK